MRLKTTLLFYLLFLSLPLFCQQYYPGGVSGAEAWYIVNPNDLANNVFPNRATGSVKKLEKCEVDILPSLFNFNPSIKTQKLCLFYTAPLEITTSRNIFFVGEPSGLEVNMSHLTTNWNPLLEDMAPTDSIIRNRFDISNKLLYINKKTFSFNSDMNANVNFYNWNIYQVDRKLNSYGYNGETNFYIGRDFNIPNTDIKDFSGNFPEYISFPFELTDNQKNRVESYLALKYGITLNGVSYKNAKNVIFWNKTNNGIFRRRIFGIGRDDISGLNQLQSESIHRQLFLAASVNEKLATNQLKMAQLSISNNNFIVFGDDNGSINPGAKNAFQVAKMTRIWLTQKTGSDLIPMYFTLNVPAGLISLLQAEPTNKLWMLHDRFVTNLRLSDFNSHYVDYYTAAEPFDLVTATFKNVYFDADNNTYDQYTFGVGPQMIVQVRFDGTCPESDKIPAKVVITGGEAPYKVSVNGAGGYYEGFTTPGQTQDFIAISPETYTVQVTDANNYVSQTVIDVQLYPITVDLGPDRGLSATQTSITLDAGLNVSDPAATYQWKRNGVIIPLYTSTLVVSQPGTYTVEVTSGNRMCIVTDEIIISYDFLASATPHSYCATKTGDLTIKLSGGVAPFTTVVSGNGDNIVQVHNSIILTVDELGYGTYTITSTDANGQTYQTTATIVPPFQGFNNIDLYSQIQQACPAYNNYQYICSDPVILDASLDNPNDNLSYEWFINGISTNINTPAVQLYYSEDYCANAGYGDGFNEYMVRVTNNLGCFRESVLNIGICYGLQPYTADAPLDRESGTVNSNEDKDDLNFISTQVYPNPSSADAIFNYTISSSKGVFEGVVEIYSATGALLSSTYISGNASYQLPFNLYTSGVYYIKTTTNGTTITDRIIIK
jgi:hypothetical protein